MDLRWQGLQERTDTTRGDNSEDFSQQPVREMALPGDEAHVYASTDWIQEITESLEVH